MRDERVRSLVAVKTDSPRTRALCARGGQNLAYAPTRFELHEDKSRMASRLQVQGCWPIVKSCEVLG
jgi:hypothetical protein